MYTTLKYLHSGWAYIVLIAVALATINALIGYFSKREYKPRDFRLALFSLIVTHTMFLIGIALILVSPMGFKSVKIDHPIVMLIAAVLITIGYSKHKKKLVSTPKLKMLAIFYSIAFVLILSRIPWGQWVGF